MDAPGWLGPPAGQPPLRAVDNKVAEVYIRVRVIAEGTDGKKVTAEFFRYQIGTSFKGSWVISKKDDPDYKVPSSGNTPLPKTFPTE